MLDNDSGQLPDEIIPDEEPKKPKDKPRKKGGVMYIGGRRFIVGVPAVDMTAKRWALVPKEKQRRALALGLVKEQ